MPITHTVKAGETLWGIAKQYGYKPTSEQQVLDWAKQWGYTGKPESLQIGTILTIPTEAKVEKPPEEKPPGEEVIPKVEITPKERVKELEATAFLLPTETPEMETTRKELEKATEDYETAVGEIRENPWLSEAGRVGREKKTYEMYEMKAKRLEEKYTALAKTQETERAYKIKELEYLAKRYPEEEGLWPEGVPSSYKEFILAGKPGAVEMGEESAYAKWLEAKKKITSEEMIADISEFLEKRKGADEMVSADTYVAARTRWIGLGGSRGDFEASFPVEKYLGEWEWPKLPADLRPKKETITKTELKPELFANIRAIKREAEKITDKTKRRAYEDQMRQALLDAYPEFTLSEIEDYWYEVE